MRLETKLACSTGLLVGALVVSAIIGHSQLSRANTLSESIIAHRTPLIDTVRDLQLWTLKGIDATQKEVLFAGAQEPVERYSKQRRQNLDEAKGSLDALLKRTNGLVPGADGLQLGMIEAQTNALKTAEEEVERENALHTPAGNLAASELVQTRLPEIYATLDQSLLQIRQTQRDQINAEMLRLQQANGATQATLGLAMIAGALLGGLLSMSLARRITRGVEQVARRADAIADGDLTGNELQLKSGDQIEMLASSMNRMQANLKAIIGTVADTAGTLTGSAVSMRSASDQIHQRIDQQSQQTRQAATAMQQMSASIAEVSRHTQSAAETARSAAQTAREGGTIVKQMLESMHSIATAVSDTSSTVGLLGDDSKRISQIITVIDEIARKTNLLALNAAIEAARAGEQGRGFAVVAGEVRRLAESTAKATGEIGTMIGEIQERTRSAIGSMASGTNTVRQGVVTTTQAGEALERIIGMAERVDRMITQIAIAASQQAAAADQSSASLDSIHTLSHDNLKEMATTAAGIESLRGTAVHLEKQVDRFHMLDAEIDCAA